VDPVGLHPPISGLKKFKKITLFSTSKYKCFQNSACCGLDSFTFLLSGKTGGIVLRHDGIV
jgi:hypothetical protein